MENYEKIKFESREEGEQGFHWRKVTLLSKVNQIEKNTVIQN